MKKLFILLLSLALVFALAACGGEETTEEDTQTETVEPAADGDTAATEEEPAEEAPAEDNFTNGGVKVIPFETAVEGCTIEANKNGSSIVDILLKDAEGKNVVWASVRTYPDQAAVDSSKRPYEDPAKCSVSEVTYADIAMTEYTYLAPASGWDINRIFYWEADGALFMMNVSYNETLDAAAADTFIAEMVANSEAVPQ